MAETYNLNKQTFFYVD